MHISLSRQAARKTAKTKTSRRLGLLLLSQRIDQEVLVEALAAVLVNLLTEVANLCVVQQRVQPARLWQRLKGQIILGERRKSLPPPVLVLLLTLSDKAALLRRMTTRSPLVVLEFC